jgi:hypothetical protein
MTADDGVSRNDTANGPDGGEPDEPSARIPAISALYQAERATLSNLSGQTLVLLTVLVTYGVAVVTALAAGRVHDPWALALPIPAWIVLGYRATVGADVTAHAAVARLCQDKLIEVADLGEDVPTTVGARGARGWWVGRLGQSGSLFLSFGVATLLVLGFTLYCIICVGDLHWWLRAVAGVPYAGALVVLAAAWMSNIAEGHNAPRWVRSLVNRPPGRRPGGRRGGPC